MKTWHTIKLETGVEPGRCKIWLDGVEISSAVRGVDIFTHVDHVPIVHLELTCNVEVEGDVGILKIHKPKRGELGQ